MIGADRSSSIREERFKIHKAQLDRWKHAGIEPADATAARAVLLKIVDKATERLRTLETEHQRVADIVDGLQTDILSFEEGKTAEQICRLQARCNRLLLRNVDAIHNGRRNEAEGWGRTKQERERRKEDRRGRNRGDERLVVDEKGIIRNADGYEGNLEEGLIRYEGEFGRQPIATTDSPREIDKHDVPRVPDFARWTPPTVESRNAAGGKMNQVIDAEPGFGNGDEGVEPNAVVPLMLTDKGERANSQNEMDGPRRKAARNAGLRGSCLIGGRKRVAALA